MTNKEWVTHCTNAYNSIKARTADEQLADLKYLLYLLVTSENLEKSSRKRRQLLHVIAQLSSDDIAKANNDRSQIIFLLAYDHIYNYDHLFMFMTVKRSYQSLLNGLSAFLSVDHNTIVATAYKFQLYLGFLKTATIEGKQDELHCKAVEDFIENDTFHSIENQPLLNYMKYRVCSMTRRYSLEDLREIIKFSHGPGATSDAGKDLLFKELFIKILTPRTKYLISKYGYYEYDEDEYMLINNISPSKLITVPKNASKRRTICEEPALLQYLQHGFLKCFEHLFRTDKHLKHIIHLNDQGFNAGGAFRASLSPGYLSTIDLSAASDRVSLDLVKTIFSDSPWRDFVLLSRSTTTLIDGKIHQLKKFAPMGSSLCFPMENLIFALVLEYSSLKCGWEPSALYQFFELLVFGDDIICPTFIVQEVIRNLESLGFFVNKEKSYYGDSHYYESCGTECHAGTVLDTFKVSRTFLRIPKSVFDIEALPQYIAFYNRCFIRNNKHLLLGLNAVSNIKKSFLFHNLKDYEENPSDTLLSNNNSNYHLKKRWNPCYQRDEFLAHRIVNKVPNIDLSSFEEERLKLALRNASTEPGSFDRLPNTTALSLSRPGVRRKWSDPRGGRGC